MNRTEFINKLYQFCEGQIEIRPIPGQPAFFDTNDIAGIDSHCQRFEKTNLYFGVGTRDGNGGKKENVVNIPYVWADVDFKSTPRDIAKEHLGKFPFKPSLIVSSGGGFHLYWMLKEPAGKSDFAAVEDVNRRIAEKLGDDDVHDAARILRIPDTFNRKPEYNPSPLCEVLRFNDFYYTLEGFLEVLPKSNDHKKTEDPKETDWLAKAMQGVSENRNTTGTKIAGYFINKVSPSDVLSILRSWNHNNKPPLDDKEIEAIAKSVSRYQLDVSTKHRVDMSNVYDPARMIEEYREYIKTLKQNRFITGIDKIDKRIRGVAAGRF